MSNSATGLNGAWAKVLKPEPTPAETAALAARRREDFDFMVLCASKGNMGLYHMLRDRSIDNGRGW